MQEMTEKRVDFTTRLEVLGRSKMTAAVSTRSTLVIAPTAKLSEAR